MSSLCLFLAMASDDVERASKIKGKRRDGGEIYKGEQIIFTNKKEIEEMMKNTDCEVDVHVSTYTTFKQRLNYHYYYY